MCTFAQYSCVYISPGVHGRTLAKKNHKSIAGTSPRYRFMVTMEPGTRQIKFFDTKLQMFESLNFIQKITTCNSQIETSENIRRL